MESWTLLGQVILLLGAALVAGTAMARLKQSPMLGYILVGMFLGGPGSVRMVSSDAELHVIAELGVSLLLFSIGLEFSWTRLKSFGGRALLAGAAQVVGTLLVAALGAHLFGLGTAESIALGAVVSLSSTAAVLRLLLDQGESDSSHGRNCIAVLLTQDIAIVPLAILMTLLSGGSGPLDIARQVGTVLLMGAALVVSLYLVLHHVAIRALRVLALERTRELTVLLAVVVGLGSTWAAHAAGLSPALGAFLAGMFLGGSPFATQVRADVASLRIVLVTLFFASAGFVADPFWIADHALLVVGVTSLVMLGKIGVLVLVLRGFGHALGTAVASAICLSQVGEFAFVLGGIAMEEKVLSSDTYALVVSVAILSLIVTPYLVMVAPRIADWVRARTPSTAPDTHHDPDEHPQPDAIVVGFGPAGEAAAAEFADAGVPTLVLDLNPSVRGRARELGMSGMVGDARQVDVLEHAGIVGAKWIVITVPSRAAAVATLHQVRGLNPRAQVMVRTRYRLHREEIEKAGAHVVVDDEDEVGRGLRRQIRATLRRGKRPRSPSAQA